MQTGFCQLDPLFDCKLNVSCILDPKTRALTRIRDVERLLFNASFKNDDLARGKTIDMFSSQVRNLL